MKNTGKYIISANASILLFFLISGLFLLLMQGIERNAVVCLCISVLMAACIALGFMSRNRDGIYPPAYSFMAWFLIMLQYDALSLTGNLPGFGSIAAATAKSAVYALIAAVFTVIIFTAAGFILNWFMSSDTRITVALVIIIMLASVTAFAGIYAANRVAAMSPPRLNIFTTEGGE